MCLAVPLKLLEVNGSEGLAEFNDVSRKVRLDFVKAKPGEYVLVHAGFAIEVIDPEQAEEDRALFREVIDAI